MVGILPLIGKVMTTKLIVIVGVSIATVVGMFFLGKLADDKGEKNTGTEKK